MRLLAGLLLTLVLLGAAFAETYGDYENGGEMPLPEEERTLGISLGTGSLLGLTTPDNGDRNPYGVYVIPRTLGLLQEDYILVTNFNDANNLPGRGSTIIQFAPDGTSEVFAEIRADTLPQDLICPGGIGLTSALVVLRRGWVIVGSFPSVDGTTATADAGCLLILDPWGNVVHSLWGEDIRGPWAMTVRDRGSHATLFIANNFDERLRNTSERNLNSADILRIELLVPEVNAKGLTPIDVSRTRIGSGFALESHPSRFIIGPSGLALSRDHAWLYVTDTLFNRIAAIPRPLYRDDTAYTGEDRSALGLLNLPLGLIVDPSLGHLLTVNGGDGLLIELDETGRQLDSAEITINGADALFGLAIDDNIIYFGERMENALGKWELPILE